MRSAHPAVANLSFLIVRPATCGDVLAREIDDYVEAVQRLGANLVLVWVPFNFARFGRAADQASYRRPIRRERGNQRRAHQPTGARDCNLHLLVSFVRESTLNTACILTQTAPRCTCR